MRVRLDPATERHRVRRGPLASDPEQGMTGAFLIPGPCGNTLSVISSDGSDWSAEGLPGEPWEHVSVSLPNRDPMWREMDFVRRLFWNDDEWVVQFHPAVSAHINIHDHCLHLWRPAGGFRQSPPPECV